MENRTLTYFVSDVHLGLRVGSPAEREARFVSFLRSIPAESTQALYMLGDIWDFWYEYKDVVPRGYVRVFAALMDLKDAGVDLYFFPGNHDMWCYSYFGELGIKVLQQPYVVRIGEKTFCLGHGDGLGPVPFSYRVIKRVFSSKVTQALFSSLHPTLAFRFGCGWSKSSRQSHPPYKFRGADEPLVKFAEEFSRERKVDCFIFGHYHDEVDMTLESGARLMMTRSWIEDSPYLYSDGSSVFFGHSKKTEK